MNLECLNCGNKNAARWRKVYPSKSDPFEMCNRCGLGGSGGIPDVFWDGKPEENLADDPNTGKPRVFSSKGEKAAYLKQRGIMEAGDKVNGAPFSAVRNSYSSCGVRDEAKLALKKVKEMGRDARRREYLKIIRERRYA